MPELGALLVDAWTRIFAARRRLVRDQAHLPPHNFLCVERPHDPSVDSLDGAVILVPVETLNGQRLLLHAMRVAGVAESVLATFTAHSLKHSMPALATAQPL